MVQVPALLQRVSSALQSSGLGEEEQEQKARDAEIARNLWKNYRILPPTSPWRERWNQLMLYLVLYNCFQIPFSLAYSLDEDAKDGFRIFDIIVDSGFAVDILLNFRTSYIEDEEIERDSKVIMKRYAKGWFLIDFLATFPWQAIGDLKFMKIIKVARLSRLAKGGSLRAASSARILRLAGGWMLVAHWVACIWFAIGAWGFEQQKNTNETNQYTSWMTRVPPLGRAITEGDVFSPQTYDACMERCTSTHTSIDSNKSKYSSMAVYLECISGLKFQTYLPDGNVSYDWCDENNFFPYIQTKEDWVNQYLSSFYWSLTMLMKTPFVGPDTVTEKFFACFVVILGAILFALLLGQFTAFLNSMGKSSAQLRDRIAETETFCATRKIPDKFKQKLVKQIRADWSVTLGMDSTAILKDFPFALRVEVLSHVFQPLIDVNPAWMRCSEQLKLHMLTLFKPGVALKKETIVHGGHYGSTVYVLIKGTLQCSLSQHVIDAEAEATLAESTRGSRSISVGSKSKGKGKGKDKAKSRVLEREGSVVPHAASMYGGPKPSSFNVSSVSQSRILQFEANEMAKILDQHQEHDADAVAEAFEKEYLGLVDSLKVKPPPAKGEKSDKSKRSDEPQPDPISSRRSRAANQAAKKVYVPPSVELANKLSSLEREVDDMTSDVAGLLQLTQAIPDVLGELARRFVPPDAALLATLNTTASPAPSQQAPASPAPSNGSGAPPSSGGRVRVGFDGSQ